MPIYFVTWEEHMNKRVFVTVFLIISTISFLIFADNDIVGNDVFASYYGEPFHGRPTASGEIFDMNAYTAAHKTLPFGTMVEVTNLENGKKVIVRVNDRGPFVGNREIDLSRAAAEVLGMIGQGIARVLIRKVGQQEISKTPSTSVSDTKDDVMSKPVETSQNVEEERIVPKDTPNKPLVYTPTNAEETSGVLWRVQVGSFTREENALQMVIKLRDIGFEPAYEKTETHVRVVLYGIRPTDLENVKRALDKNGYRGYVIRQESW